jgi:nitric oxide reductase activation protein
MNKQSQLLQNSLPLIGAGLGDKLGVRITVSGNQAWTNGTTINIPDFNISSKDEKNAVLGFMSHEAAHIKFDTFKGITDADVRNPLQKAFWNIFEDLRIEKNMIRSMIGTKKWMDQIWINRQKSGTRKSVTSKDKPASIVADYLLFSCRVNYRKQDHLMPYLDAAEESFIEVFGWKLLTKLQVVLNGRLDSLSSSVDAMNLAKDVLKLLNEHEPEEEEKEEPEKEESNEESEGDSEGESEQGSGSQSNEESEDDSEGEASNEQGRKSVTNLSGQHEPSAEAVKQALAATLNSNGSELTDEMDNFAESMETLANANSSKVPVSIPEAVQAESSIAMNPYGSELLKIVKQTSNTLTAKLQAIVQESMRVKSKTTTSGKRLNSKVLSRYAVGDGRLFTTKQQKQSIDTIVEIAIDNSGSMVINGENLLKVAKEAQLALALALSRINGVSITASAFPESWREDDKIIRLMKEGEQVKHLANRLSLCTGQGVYTPSGSAMWHCLKTVIGSNKQKKVVIFITDGYPSTDEQSEALVHLVNQAEKSDITVIGIAIGSIAYSKPEFQRYFKHALFISDIRDLKTELFKVAQNILTA